MWTVAFRGAGCRVTQWEAATVSRETWQWAWGGQLWTRGRLPCARSGRWRRDPWAPGWPSRAGPGGSAGLCVGTVTCVILDTAPAASAHLTRCAQDKRGGDPPHKTMQLWWSRLVLFYRDMTVNFDGSIYSTLPAEDRKQMLGGV